jgi:hypothetical protein
LLGIANGLRRVASQRCRIMARLRSVTAVTAAHLVGVGIGEKIVIEAHLLALRSSAC